MPNSQLPRVGDLDIDQDLALQKKTWAFQRAGRVGLILFLMAAVVGFFGSGPVSRSIAEKEIRVEYQRLGRLEAPMNMNIEVPPELFKNGEFKLMISRDYLSEMEIKTILPQPEFTRGAGEDIVFIFRSEGSHAVHQIRFTIEAGVAGKKKLRIVAGDHAPIELNQFIYP